MSALEFIGQNPATVAKALTAAINMVGVEEAPLSTPQGELGGCVACGHTVRSHFGPDGAWIGCLKGTGNTVFVLVAVRKDTGKATPREHSDANGSRAIAHETATAPVSETDTSRPRRLRYTSTVDGRRNIDKLPLSPTRRKVLKAVHRVGKDGILAKQVLARTKLPHGSVQQTLNWLRNHKFVHAEPVDTSVS